MLEQLSAQLEAAFSSLPEDASRLFHGRGHCYPGWEFLNIDWFAPVVWVVAYGQPDEALMQQVQTLLIAQAEQVEAVEAVVIQQRIKGRAQQDVVYGQLPEVCFAKEAGAQYHLNFAANQNIGFFLDAMPGRQWVRHRADGKRVLNTFSYTCSFSVAALQGGASHVVNIDMAKGVLATGQRNHALNQLARERASFLPHDFFRSTRKLEKYGPYDLVILDPPSRQKGSFEADKDYGKLLRKLKPMLADGAEILACLNAPYLDADFLQQKMAENLPQAKFVERLSQREDFPETDLNSCLKMLVYKFCDDEL